MYDLCIHLIKSIDFCDYSNLFFDAIMYNKKLYDRKDSKIMLAFDIINKNVCFNFKIESFCEWNGENSEKY
jgi:hypothetical protein